MKVQWASSNGLKLAYTTEGEGPAVVMVMGIGAQLVHWPDEFCTRIAAHGYRVIRFDNRDAGQSSSVVDAHVPYVRLQVLAAFLGRRMSAPYTLTDMAADTTGLMDALGIETAHVMGMSMGGMIAQTVAIEHPERVLSLASIASTTGARHIGKLSAYRALLSPSGTTREQVVNHVVRVFQTIGSPGYPFDESALRERANLGYTRGHNPDGFLRQLAALTASGSRTRRLSSVACPTLVVHGREDPLIPLSAGEETATAVPGAELRAFAGMGHDLPRTLWPDIIDALVQNFRRGDTS